jgi:hypothetical protein
MSRRLRYGELEAEMWHEFSFALKQALLIVVITGKVVL